MIRHQQGSNGTVRITFELPADRMFGTVSVVGDFNDWQPGVTTFQGRGSTRTAFVDARAGRRYRFRYLGDGGYWFDDDAADDYERNEQGEAVGVVDLSVGPRQ